MWVKLYTNLLNWEWYSDKNTKILFIHCLLKANWKEGKFEGIEVPRGSFVTSLPKLSEETGLSIQQVRTSLKHLISTGELTDKGYTKFRVITIVNYEKYQERNSQTNIQLTDNQQTTNSNIRITEYQNIDSYSYLEQKFGRTVSSAECKKIEQWQKWFDDEIINYAIYKTVTNGAKALSYTEAIINAWHDKGYKILEECINENLKIEEREMPELFEYDWLHEE